MNKDIWEDQFEFNEKFFSDNGLDLKNLSMKEKVHWAKEFFFHTNKEMTDIINCFPKWRMHYQSDEEENEVVFSNLVEEYIDTFKYFMGLGQILGISYEDILKGYEDKTEVVKQKYEQNKKFLEFSKTPVVVFDIDGVINNYPNCFLDWVKKEDTKYDFSSVNSLKKSLNLKEYEELKTKYRLSGAKREQPINKDTVEYMKSLKDLGEKIVLFTNRPVSKFKQIYTDTLYWLKTNDIPFDAIYWSDYEKKEDIYKHNLKIKFIVEDNLENTKNFNRQGHLVFLINTEYNKEEYYNSKLFRVSKISDIHYIYERMFLNE